MLLSHFLARLIGPVLAIIGVSMLGSAQGYLDIATGIIGDGALLYFAAVLGLLAGLALVLSHNVWVSDWRLIITLIGWLTVIESAAWILAPKLLARLYAPLLVPTMPLLVGVIALIVAAALCYFGYFVTTATRTSTGRRK
jgi:hypothetical protein